jgi:hypothetical protein
MKEFQAAAAFGVACMSLTGVPAQAETASTPAARQVVSRSEQAQRDDERLRILRDEWAREQRAAADAARRQAERSAMSDPRGAEEAAQAQRRASENLAALQREIAAATTAGAPPAPLQPSLAMPSRPPHAPVPRASDRPDPTWWDVYARSPQRTDGRPAQGTATTLIAPRTDAPAPLSQH